jgi:hypothetical protein
LKEPDDQAQYHSRLLQLKSLEGRHRYEEAEKVAATFLSHEESVIVLIKLPRLQVAARNVMIAA